MHLQRASNLEKSCKSYGRRMFNLPFSDKTKLIARLVLRQRPGQNLLANISTSRTSLFLGQYKKYWP